MLTIAFAHNIGENHRRHDDRRGNGRCECRLAIGEMERR